VISIFVWLKAGGLALDTYFRTGHSGIP